MTEEFWWTVGSTVVLVAFNLGMVYQMIKNKPSEEKVGEIIEKKFENHCPFTLRINNLESDKKEIANDLKIETEYTRDSLQEIKFNLKSLCKVQGVEYIDTSGHKG